MAAFETNVLILFHYVFKRNWQPSGLAIPEHTQTHSSQALLYHPKALRGHF